MCHLGVQCPRPAAKNLSCLWIKVLVILPLREAHQVEGFSYFHFFDHPLYNQPDSLRKETVITMEGEDPNFISTQETLAAAGIGFPPHTAKGTRAA